MNKCDSERVKQTVVLTSAVISASVWRENVGDLPSSQRRFIGSPSVSTTANRHAAVCHERFVAESLAAVPASPLPGTGGATCQPAMARQLSDVRVSGRSVLDSEPVVRCGVVRLCGISHASRSDVRGRHGNATIDPGALEDGLMR